MLRSALDIKEWVVFGGSWGSTLSLTYSQTHPSRVTCLMLRGIFTLRRSELLFFYQDGASHLFPDAWESYIAPIPQEERVDMISAYYKYLTGSDIEKRNQCALAWSKWEMSTSKLVVDPAYLARSDDPKWAAQFARNELGYLAPCLYNALPSLINIVNLNLCHFTVGTYRIPLFYERGIL
jgi:proline iminopeptidase